jgi:uncharacterized protein YdaU (DUF1376 family)
MDGKMLPHFYQFDIAHYIKDTQYLTLEQRGIYLELCHFYLQRGPIPLDLTDICKTIFPTIRPCRAIPKIMPVLDLTFEKSQEGYISTRYRSVSNKTKNNTK